MSRMYKTEATIGFYGGTGAVTGANFLFDIGDKRILIDCGAVEREHMCDEANLESFAYDPASTDVLLVTHAHADHIGRIPKLVHDGFKGVIYSTPATKDLAAIMFDDALSLMRSDNEKHGCPIMYEKHDVEAALALWQSAAYHDRFAIGSADIEFLDAGHVLGSAMVRIKRGDRHIIFSGDLGNSPEPLLNDTESPEGTNYLVMESVYGDRVHEKREERLDILRAVIEEARTRKGTLFIPSFSIERTQIILHELDEMITSGKMQPIPVYLDAPLATRVTEVFRRYPDEMNTALRERFAEGNDPFSFDGLKVTATTAQSAVIHESPDPKVIIAGAGMSSGGRIRAHEMRYLPDPNAMILFVGYQAPGSLGRRIQEGSKSVIIDGTTVPVRAKIESIEGYSGHKDRDGLLDFVNEARDTLERVFVVMGEPKSETFLAQRIRDFIGVDAIVPQKGEKISIEF